MVLVTKKPDLVLDDGTYRILVTKEGEALHLLDTLDDSEIYLNANDFKKIAELMGYNQEE